MGAPYSTHSCNLSDEHTARPKSSIGILSTYNHNKFNLPHKSYRGKKLNGKGNKQILDFVHSGGTYVGICAGSYYGGAFCEFDRNGPLQVLGSRELGFFPGTVRGPVLARWLFCFSSLVVVGEGISLELSFKLRMGHFDKLIMFKFKPTHQIRLRLRTRVRRRPGEDRRIFEHSGGLIRS